MSGCDECRAHFGEAHADGCRTAQREDADAFTFRFHGHLDMCLQCREQPMNLCATGDSLLREAAESCATVEELRYLDDRIFGKRPAAGRDS